MSFDMERPEALVEDADGDGDVDAADVLQMYDQDGDGLLSQDELQPIFERLHTQTEYTNSLLTTLEDVQAQNLKMKDDAKQKADTLSNALQVLDTVRNESNDLKRQLKVAREVAENSNNQCREARVLNETLKRDRDNLAREKGEAGDALKELTASKDHLAHELAREQEDHGNTKGKLSEEREVARDNIEHYRSLHDDLHQQHEELKALHGPLDEKCANLTETVRQLTKDNDGLQESLHKARQDAETANQQSAQAKQREEITHEKLELKVKEHEDEMAKSEQLHEQVRAHEEHGKELEAELEGKMELIAQANDDLKKNKAEIKALQNELDTVGKELLSQATLRKQDQERWHTKLTEAQEQLARALGESRLEAQRYATESQHRTVEHLEARKEHENQYIALQADHAALHLILAQQQAGERQRSEEWEKERERARQTLAEAKKEFGDLKTSFDALENQKIAEEKRLKDELAYVKQELHSRGVKYLNMISQMQDSMQSVRKEAVQSMTQKKEIEDMFGAFKALAVKLQETQKKPIHDWNQQTHDALEALINQNKELRKETEDLEDKERHALMEKEEEKAKNLMLEEEKGRLEFDHNTLERKIEEMKRAHGDELQSKASAHDQLFKQKQEGDERLRNLQARHDKAVKESNEHKQNYQKGQEELLAARNDHNNALSSKASALEEERGKVRDLEASRDGLQKDRVQLQETRSQLEAQMYASLNPPQTCHVWSDEHFPPVLAANRSKSKSPPPIRTLGLLPRRRRLSSRICKCTTTKPSAIAIKLISSSSRRRT